MPPSTTMMFRGRRTGQGAHPVWGKLSALAWAVRERLGGTVLRWELVIILLLTPAVTAGAIGREKERGTLLAVFGTELTAGAIVTGKVLGRLAVLAQVLLTALPLLVLLAYVADFEPAQVAGAFLQA